MLDAQRAGVGCEERFAPKTRGGARLSSITLFSCQPQRNVLRGPYMRNYIKVDNATIFGDDGVSPQVLTFFGQFPGQALAIAQVTADQLLAGGWVSANAIQNPDIYVLLNKGLATSLMINPTSGSQPAGGLLGQTIFENLQSISSQFGLDPFVSPKEQDVRPWNGRKK
jgi:hypothetical protein